MLISHRKKFIFTKTVKTAGTSVESYFEPYCMPEGQWKKSHGREEYVSDTGIVGYRGPNPVNGIWYNHMAASEIRDLIGADVWNQYFKFTVVRNPFDKLVSGFYMLVEGRRKKYTTKDWAKAYAKRLLKRASPVEGVTGKSEIERFRNWIKLGGTIVDRDKYLIDGEICVDYFIQFENLQSDIEEICKRLSIEMDEQSIPGFKKNIRNHRIPVCDYYDDETEKIVRQLYAWEFEKFDYRMPD